MNDIAAKSNHFATAEISAVAFAAFRLNDNNLYQHSTVYDILTGQPQRVTTNKDRMRQHFLGEQPLTVSDQDRENARLATELIVDWVVMQTLQESHVAPFVGKLKDALLAETNPLGSCGMFAHLPDQYAKISKRKSNQEALALLNYSSDWFGNIGKTMEFALTVLDSRYVPKFSCYYVFGYTPDGNAVGFFTGNESCTSSGEFTGKVKRHNLDSYRNNTKVTEFNYIKKKKLVDAGT